MSLAISLATITTFYLGMSSKGVRDSVRALLAFVAGVLAAYAQWGLQ